MYRARKTSVSVSERVCVCVCLCQEAAKGHKQRQSENRKGQPKMQSAWGRLDDRPEPGTASGQRVMSGSLLVWVQAQRNGRTGREAAVMERSRRKLPSTTITGGETVRGGQRRRRRQRVNWLWRQIHSSQ
jgi:hypothetical protein